MKQIVVNDLKEFIETILMHLVKEIGTGSEGKCYLNDNDEAVKLYFKDNIESGEYDINKIISADEISCEHFIFPKELILYKKKFIGYKAKMIKNNLLNADRTLEFNNILDIDFEKLKNAYTKMKNEAKMLGNEKIEIFDLMNNLLFNGENLYAIDNCNYKRVTNEGKSKNVEDSNVEAVEYALELELNQFLTMNGYKYIEKNKGETFVEYLDRFKYIIDNNLMQEMESDIEQETIIKEYAKSLCKKFTIN